jgi:hypothetical protein
MEVVTSTRAAGSASSAVLLDVPPPCSVLVSRRPHGADSPVDSCWDQLDSEVAASAEPWRSFRWFKGQKHYSGTFWSATEQGHVVYESRLELTRLLLADFDAVVRRIATQPFLLRTVIAGIERKHVPDFLLITDSGPAVVDVKPFGSVLPDQSRTAATSPASSSTAAAMPARMNRPWPSPPALPAEPMEVWAGS